jgi:hypothetical protein
MLPQRTEMVAIKCALIRACTIHVSNMGTREARELQIVKYNE